MTTTHPQPKVPFGIEEETLHSLAAEAFYAAFSVPGIAFAPIPKYDTLSPETQKAWERVVIRLLSLYAETIEFAPPIEDRK